MSLLFETVWPQCAGFRITPALFLVSGFASRVSGSKLGTLDMRLETEIRADRVVAYKVEAH
jgi:hypothetical protein